MTSLPPIRLAALAAAPALGDGRCMLLEHEVDWNVDRLMFNRGCFRRPCVVAGVGAGLILVVVEQVPFDVGLEGRDGMGGLERQESVDRKRRWQRLARRLGRVRVRGRLSWSGRWNKVARSDARHLL